MWRNDGAALVWLVALATGVLGSKQCDHEIWDDSAEGRGVKKVDVDCNSGRIEWHGPYGALYLSINGPEEPYRLCIQAYTLHTPAMIFSVQDSSFTKILHINESKSRDTAALVTRCFPARGAATWYIESGVGSPVSSEIIIDYDVETNPRRDECQPCTDEELLWHYCTSDFVAIGHMDELKATTAESIIPVSLDQVKQQSTKYFTKDSIKGKYRGQLHAPSRCGMQFGSDKFVFMGQFKFNRAELRCAPTYDDFLSIQRASKRSLPCS